MGSEEATKKVGDHDLKQIKEMSDSRKEAVNNSWVVVESCGDISVNEQSRSTASSIDNSSVNSTTSSSSSDFIEDASSSTLSSSSSSSVDDVPNGPSFELSDLMIHLPLRRGLSKYYEGKSQSFTSLASVENIEDLAKKMSPYVMKKKMKTCKSYLNVQKSDIRKKSQRGSFLSNSFRISSRPNSVPLHKVNF